MKVNPVQKKKMTEEISLMEDAVYIVKDGHMTIVTPRVHGEDTLIWKNNQVLDIIRSQRHRLEDQKVI